MHRAGIERKILRPVDIVECSVAVAEAVVIADYRDKRYAGVEQHVACPHKFFDYTEICLVSTVDYKINISTFDDDVECRLHIIERALCVGDKGELEWRLEPGRLYEPGICGVEVCWAFDLRRVGLVLQHVAGPYDAG